MEKSEFGNPVLVREQHEMILTCAKKSLQELEKRDINDDSNLENFVVDLEENVKQEDVQVEKLCNGSIDQENKKEKAFCEEQENTKDDDTTVLTMVHKEPELQLNNTVGIKPLPHEYVELVSQLENNYANKMNKDTQTKVDNTIDESYGNFSNENVHPKMDNPDGNAVILQNNNLTTEMDNTKNEDDIVTVFQTNEPVQPEMNRAHDEMDNSHGAVILQNENLKTEMENTKNISNPLNKEILVDEDLNIVAVFPTNENVQPELNDTHGVDNTDVVILANRNHSSNQSQPDTLDHNDPIEVVDKSVQPEMNNTAGDVWVKLQPKQRVLTEVLDNNKELHHKIEEDGICETRKTYFVSPTSQESQADVWIKAGDPLSSEGSLPGRCNKVGVPDSKEESPTEHRNKAQVLISSEEECLFVHQDGYSKERISCKDNAACVNTESVLIDLLDNLQDDCKGKCTDNQCHATEDNKGKKKSKKQKEKRKKVSNTNKVIKDLKPKSRQDDKKKDTEKSKVKKDRKVKKDKSFLNRIVTFFYRCVCFNDDESFLKDDTLHINDSKEEPTTKELGRNQCSKISLTETKPSTAGNVSGCMVDENGVQSQNKYSLFFEKTKV